MCPCPPVPVCEYVISPPLLAHRPQPGYSLGGPSLIPCAFPATTRCAGWNVSLSASVCGAGYVSADTGCSGCARGYYPDLGVCMQCPSSGAQKTTTIAVFVGGVMAVFVCVVTAVAVLARILGGKWLWGSAVFRGRDFIAWAMVTWQTIVQVGKRTTEAPPLIRRIYSALTVLELVCECVFGGYVVRLRLPLYNG